MTSEINKITLSDLYEPIIYFENNITKYRYKGITIENKEIRFTVFVKINNELKKYLDQKIIPFTSYRNWKGRYKNTNYNYYELYLPTNLSNFKNEYVEKNDESILHS